MSDEKRGPIARYGRDNRAVTMQGPFELKQGGKGIAVRNPVFIADETGVERFWGFTIIIIRVPDIFEQTVRGLRDFDYDYTLYKSDPLSDEFKLVDATVEKLDAPQTAAFEAGECSWVLEVAPKGGWDVSGGMTPLIILSCVVVILLTALMYILHIVMEDRRLFSKLSNLDPLTSLDNRRSYADMLTHLAEAGTPYGIFYMDVDRFKMVNDTYGHQAGNEVLKEVAARLQAATPYRVFRLGGDEFAILVTDEHPEAVYEDMLGAIEAVFDPVIKVGDTELEVNLSIGYARVPDDARDPNMMREIADRRMYQMKQAHKENY